MPDLSRRRRLHVIGVGGAAMSAIASIARTMGHRVSGSDQADGAVLARLAAEGCDVWSPHDPARLAADIDLVAVSTAIRHDNAELVALRRRGVEVATRPDVMEALGALKRTVAVSGTAGKTTTAAMMALIATAVRWRPSMIVGASIEGLGHGVDWTDSEWFVVEADESDGSFLRFRAEAVIVTNIEPDHLDLWGSMERLEAGFDQFVRQASGPKVVSADDPGVTRLRARVGPVERLVTVGFAEGADHRIVGFRADGLTSRFRLDSTAGSLPVTLCVPGEHNAANAAATLAMAIELGVDPAAASDALATFRGASRRFEYRGAARGVTFVDDYAHLPMKARAAVNAALLGGWSRVVAVYQPHRYTRTQDLWRDYADSFTGVDLLLVTGIYAAGQQPIDGVSGRLIADAVRTAHPDQRVVYCETRAEVVALLVSELRAGDLCLTMNAGDLTTLPDELLTSDWAS